MIEDYIKNKIVNVAKMLSVINNNNHENLLRTIGRFRDDISARKRII